ncbi:hypothetical protein N0824_01001 [Microcystis sp. 0824]|nr:hypothetical protein N0824_01001 [Microcystis sp. 0824]
MLRIVNKNKAHFSHRSILFFLEEVPDYNPLTSLEKFGKKNSKTWQLIPVYF